MSKLVEALKANQIEVDNQTTSDKGDDAYHSSLNACVDLYASMGALRGRKREFLAYFEKAFEEDQYKALALLLKLRDIKNGCGERQLVREALLWLEEKGYLSSINGLTELMVKYGRWDDIMQYRYKETIKTMANAIAYVISMTPLNEQFHTRKTRYKQNMCTILAAEVTYGGLLNTVPLLAKWLPRKPKQENQRYLLNQICHQLGWTRKLLRQWCSQYKTVETLISANEWVGVNYSHVPSQTMVKLRDAFKRNDGSRFTEWVESLREGKEGVKVNASTVTPGQLVRNRLKLDYDDYTACSLIGEQWRSLPDYFNGSKINVLPIVDGSGSMYSFETDERGIQTIDVATGLGIYIAQRNQGIFHNTLISFGERPRFIELKDEISLKDAILKVRSVNDVSTNYDATYRLILEMAQKHQLKQEDLPDMIVILSDMNFDHSISWRTRHQWDGKDEVNEFKTAFQRLEEAFAEAGYKAPSIVYWNLNHNGTFTCKKNEYGVVQLSGYSPSSIKDVLSSLSNLNPLEIMNKAIEPYYNEVMEWNVVGSGSVSRLNRIEKSPTNLTPVLPRYISRKAYVELNEKYLALKAVVDKSEYSDDTTIVGGLREVVGLPPETTFVDVNGNVTVFDIHGNPIQK